MRNSLWPDSLADHLHEVDRFFSNASRDIIAAFVLDRGADKLGGFIELNLRNYAEGSVAARVPYVEGWYVDADLRGKGHGKQLMAAAEKWAKQQGCIELASDAELENSASIAAHKALGFEETERIVCFLKKLK